MRRKSKPYYKIVYDYQGIKRYEDVKLQTYDRNKAIEYFLDLFRKKQDGSLILDSDCRVQLRAEINIYIRNAISLIEYKKSDKLNEILDKMEKTLTTSYESLRYTIKIATDSGILKNYKPILETEVKDEALEKFLYLFRQKQMNMLAQESIIDVVLEVSISPFDTRCLYLSYIEKEKNIFSELTKIEKMVINDFK